MEYNNTETTSNPQPQPTDIESSNISSAPISLDDYEVNDPELAALKKQMQQMEQEAAKLRELQAQTSKAISDEQLRDEADSRSLYIGNVDYSTTPEELQAHFHSCGLINRVTILCDKWTGHPKGFAYIEFADKSSVSLAMQFEGSLLHGRPLKVSPKRTNIPGVTRGRGRGAPGYYGGGFPARGGFFMPRGARPYMRGRGRGRGTHFSPY
ncbi:Polyadenylate-binding protein 2 [Smittium mucronatum]|uniref:Polyadenylate-binding protein 2 n=1 Tax=Smittium mucronatum TaxID=133383 RepID=A0A1R0H6Y2_9FUNG|nr:Polyadenylate-binding protein 2 [Smittium mucronatum]